MEPELERSSTEKDSRMLCRREGGSLERGSAVLVVRGRAGREEGAAEGKGRVVLVGGGGVAAGAAAGGGVEALAAAKEEEARGVDGRGLEGVLMDSLRVGEAGSGVAVVPRVVSQEGGLRVVESPLGVELRRGDCATRGFSGEKPEGVEGRRGEEAVGVAARTVEGEARGELGRRKGEVRGLLKESGEGL